eukprot:6582405-Pyramimonas_sp.AAC.1
MIEARWEPQMRGGVCKWRYVAQEFKLMEQRGDVRGELISADKQADGLRQHQGRDPRDLHRRLREGLLPG